MPAFTPSVRAALPGVVLVTLVAVAAVAFVLTDLQQRTDRAASAALEGQAAVLAASFQEEPLDLLRVEGAIAALASEEAATVYLLADGAGRLLASSDAERSAALDAQLLAKPDAGGDLPVLVRSPEAGLLVAVHPVGARGYRVAVAGALDMAAPARGDIGVVLAFGLGAWGLLVGFLVVFAWYTGPYTASLLGKLSTRIAQGDADVSALIRHAEGTLGPLATAFDAVGRRMSQLGKLHGESRDHVAALYQINPNYVLLCTLDGRVIEANPAFYAITGLSPDALRGNQVDVLMDVFDVEPLREFAHRSLIEGSAIFGLEHVLVSRDDEMRPVEVALRAFSFGGKQAVLIQATDMAVRRKLERRVSAFNDTLDLMVDQRVSQLTAGQQSLRRLLDGAGVVLASFDAGGGTRRWSGGARVLTQRPAAQVPTFTAVVDALGMSPDDRDSFTRWFWGAAHEPMLVEHDLPAADGASRTCRVVWHVVVASEPGVADARSLVGLELPAADLPDVYPAHAGDGLASQVATPA
jgi:PAS domain S-box-containing protein